jgi:Phytanoyl-CoA dioxygenase (PhyH)
VSSTTLNEAGYIRIRGLFGASEVNVLRLSTPQLGFRQHRRSHVLNGFGWDSREYRLLASDPLRIARIGEASHANDLRWISGYRIDKPSQAPALEWHQDWWAWRDPVSFETAAPQVALLVYLDRTTPENGAIRVIPGSHLVPWMAQDLPIPHDPRNDLLELDHEALRDRSDAVSVCCEPGDGVLLDYRVLHGTHANTSDSARMAVHWSFTPNWADLPADIRFHLSEHPCLAGRPAEPLLPPNTARCGFVDVQRRPFLQPSLRAAS